MKGDATVGAKSAEIASPVSEGDHIVTGPEAACSVLVDKRALIQFCGKSDLRLRHDEERNATIVDVTEGSARALVGPLCAGNLNFPEAAPYDPPKRTLPDGGSQGQGRRGAATN